MADAIPNQDKAVARRHGDAVVDERENPVVDVHGDGLVDDHVKRALYQAFRSRDVRFDGQLFVGVSSTGIYCRPVCTAMMPRYENCTFFGSAAEAERAGYRPCLICRPEMAPGLSTVDASENLARRAAMMLREYCSTGEGVERLAARLGYTDRHLRRVFEEVYHVTPVQYLQTCRLLLSKSLLTDTALPVAQVARASGFGSVRRYNQLFRERYGLTPTDLRKRRRRRQLGDMGFSVRLGYRPPYRFEPLLAFFRGRALAGVEVVGDDFYSRAVRMPDSDGVMLEGWIRVENEPGSDTLRLTMSETLLPVLSQVVARVRRQFDIDCDPMSVQEQLRTLDEVVPGIAIPGTRLPGCFDPFETVCRAVLGQQVSVVAANRIAARIVAAFGAHVETGVDGLERVFPTPGEMLALDPIEDALGELGVIRSRSRTIRALAELIVSGELEIGPDANTGEQMERLLSVKGIGPWSTGYIAMRTLGYTDAFLETDAGVRHMLPGLSPRERLELVEGCRPWRSYAVMCLWNALEP